MEFGKKPEVNAMNLKRCLRGLFLLLLAILCAVFACSGDGGGWTGWLLIPTGVFALFGILVFLRGTFQKPE